MCLVVLFFNLQNKAKNLPQGMDVRIRWGLNVMFNKDLLKRSRYWILSCALSPRLSPWTWLTCEWCAGSAGSPGPWPAHRWRASQCLPGNGRSAVGDTVGPRPAGGPPPWTCLPHLGRSTWDRVGKENVSDTVTHKRVPEVKTPYRSEQSVVELRGQALGGDDLSLALWLWAPVSTCIRWE